MMKTRAEKAAEKERKDKQTLARLQKTLAKKAQAKGETPPPAVLSPPSEVAIVTETRIRRMGHAYKYQTPEDMIPVIREFFDYCIEQGQPPLITTLSLALGFASRSSIDDYLKRPEFHDVVKRAKLVCEDYAAKGLISGKNTVGFIFLLKQYGWRDVQETVTTLETHEQRIARLLQSNKGE